MGNAKVDGTLNLKSNTASGFSTNGYGLVPPDVTDSLRSYTSNASNKAYVYVDGDKRTTTAANTWQTLTFDFESDGVQPIRIGLQANHVSDEFICGFDNFKLEAHVPNVIISPIRPTVSTMRYTLDGKPATSRTRGIVIKEGKKKVQ